MPKPTFHNLPAAKRDRIVNAAIDEFSAVPYVKATLDRIVDAAGISKGSMYQYFAGKADLYRWLLTDYMPGRKMEAIGAVAPPPGTSIWVVLEQAFLAGVRFAATDPRLTRLGIRFLRDHEIEPELAAIRHAHRAASDAWLQAQLFDAVARGELRADLDIPMTAGFLAHALGEGMLDQLARRLGLTLDGLFDQPDASFTLSDDALLDLVRGVTTLFKDGAGA